MKLVFARDVLDRVKVGSAPESIGFLKDSLPHMLSIFKVRQEKNQFIVQPILDSDFSVVSKVLMTLNPLGGFCLLLVGAYAPPLN